MHQSTPADVSQIRIGFKNKKAKQALQIQDNASHKEEDILKLPLYMTSNGFQMEQSRSDWRVDFQL